jgi:hypothetical protein
MRTPLFFCCGHVILDDNNGPAPPTAIVVRPRCNLRSEVKLKDVSEFNSLTETRSRDLVMTPTDIAQG